MVEQQQLVDQNRVEWDGREEDDAEGAEGEDEDRGGLARG